MICRQCNQEIPNDAKFCPNCGTSVNTIEKKEPTIQLFGRDMTAQDLADFCRKQRFTMTKEWEKWGWKITENELELFFHNIIRVLQDDEKPLLCFAGHHGYKNSFVVGCQHVYLLTDKRLISAGWFDNPARVYMPFNRTITKLQSKLPEGWRQCAVESIYMRDITDVSANMILNSDVITFHTVQKDFNILFYEKNVTHSLCNLLKRMIVEAKQSEQ